MTSQTTKTCSSLDPFGMHTAYKCTPQQPLQQSGSLQGRQQATTECSQHFRSSHHLCTAAMTVMHFPHGRSRAGQHVNVYRLSII